MPPELRKAVLDAWPIPETVAGVWAEFAEAEKLSNDRNDLDDGNYDDFDFIRARSYVLESLLDTMPARSFSDILARLSWMNHLNDRGWSRDVREDAALLATLRADIDRQASNVDTPIRSDTTVEAVHCGHATASDRRRAALSILDDLGTRLSDREIGRRVGISPTTVGKLRRSRT